MRDVSDAFLLQMAEISAGLVGLFLVGVFFYIETGDGDRPAAGRDVVVDRYFRASTRIVLLLYAIPIGLPLTLVVMEPMWSGLLLLALSPVLIAANVQTATHVRRVARITDSTIFVITEVLGSLGVAATVTLPWILGGLHPSRNDLTWAILASFATGFLSVYATAISAFDIARSPSESGSEVPPPHP